MAAKAGAMARGARIVLAAMLAIAMAMATTMLAGCDEAPQKTHVTVGVWDGSVISSGFADRIDAANPEYDIEWIVGDDSLEFYEYQAEQGSLPDVILAKDFDQVTAGKLADSLYSLDGTDLFVQSNQTYVRSYPGNDERIVYYPASAGFEGILINEYLFDLYGVETPVDRDSFVAACQAFADRGLRGFVAGMGDAETCHEVLQGFADDSLVTQTEDLMSQILTLGSSTQSVSVDGAAFGEALDFLGDLSDQRIIDAQDFSLSPQEAENLFVQGDAAMLFLSSGEASSFGAEHNMTVRAIPFFGNEGSWAFVEPAFVGMVSNVHTEGVKATASDDQVHAAAVDVLSSIMGEEAQRWYLDSLGVDCMVASSSTQRGELPNALSTLEGCLDEGRGRLYVPSRIVSHAVGSALKDVTVEGGDAAAALEEVRSLIASDQEKDKKTVASFSEGVSNVFSEESGNVAASDIVQTVASVQGAEVGIASSYAARCPLYQGEKTATELAYAAAPMALLTAELSGEELKGLLTRAVEGCASASQLPVVSGLHLEIAREGDGYRLKSVSRIVGSSGQQTEGSSNTVAANEGRSETVEIDAQSTYRVLLASYGWDGVARAADGLSFADAGLTLQDAWVDAYGQGAARGLPSYQDYFEFV